MNVLLVTGIYPPDIGGPAHFIPRFQEFLRASGSNVQVLTLAEKTNLQTESDVIIKIERKGRISRFFKVVFRLLLASKKANIYFASGLYEETAIALKLIQKKGIARVVGDPIWERYNNSGGHKVGIEEFNQVKLTLPLKLQRKFLTWSLNQFTLIVCPSIQLKRLILRWGVKTEIVVIKNGIPIKKITKKPVENSSGLCVARLVSWKNIDKVIEICHAADISLTILGDGNELMQLQKLSEKIGARVHFGGRQSEAIVDKEFENYQFFFMLSEYEGQSFALTKALANGLLCVVSDIPGNTEIVKHLENGFVVSLQNFKESVQEFRALISNEQEIERIRQGAIQTSRKYFDESVQLSKLNEIIGLCIKQ